MKLSYNKYEGAGGAASYDDSGNIMQFDGKTYTKSQIEKTDLKVLRNFGDMDFSQKITKGQKVHFITLSSKYFDKELKKVKKWKLLGMAEIIH